MPNLCMLATRYKTSGPSLPAGGLIYSAGISDLTYTATVDLPVGQQSPGTLGRVDTIIDQAGGPLFSNSELNRPYLYGTLGDSGPPQSWSQRNNNIGGNGRGPFRVTPNVNAWAGDYTWIMHVQVQNAGIQEVAEVYNPTNARFLRLFVVSSAGVASIRHERSITSSLTALGATLNYAIGSFHTCAVTWNNSTGLCSFYSDGVAAGSQSIAVQTFNYPTTAQEWIGRRANNPAHRNCFAIAYSRQLSAGEHLDAHNFILTQVP